MPVLKEVANVHFTPSKYGLKITINLTDGTNIFPKEGELIKNMNGEDMDVLNLKRGDFIWANRYEELAGR